MGCKPTEEQLAVIKNTSDNMILFASAGTGKTFTVAQKVNFLIQNGITTADKILCLTFTLKACDEMKGDIERFSVSKADVAVKTIHGFCLDIIKRESTKRCDGLISPTVYDDVDEEEILKNLIPNLVAKEQLKKVLFKIDPQLSLNEYIELPAVFLKGRGFYKKIKRNSNPVYLRSDGDILPYEEGERLEKVTLPYDIVCPVCGKRQTEKRESCNFCSFEFNTYLKGARCGGMQTCRNVVSEIKRFRCMYGFCSGDEVKDFNDTLTKLLQNDEEHFKSLFYTANRFDGKFYETFCAYAGLIVSAYNEQLLQSNKVDFDDLIIKSLEYFSDDGVVREWRSLYDYIIIDEMQDTSDLEYSLISKLFAGNKVLMCGDMSQTIYEWRGSKPFEIYEDFCLNYGAKVFMLSQNYRSTDTLTFASFAFLKGINGGSFKRFCPQQITACGGEKGEPIRVVTLKSAMDEASWVFRYIKKHPPEGYDKLCIMSRSNGYISKFYKSLQKVNEKYPEGERLNFFTVDRDCRFYKMPIIKDMLSFFSLLVNPSDFENFERIAKRHIHGVGSVTLSALSEYKNVGVSLSAFLESDTYLCGDRYQSLINSLGHNNVVVYDIETTGLDRGYDQIIQLAAVKIDENGKVLKRFERKVVPTVPIGEGAERTHGFTLEMLKAEGTTIDAALTEFLEFCKGACLVGHNSTNFDRIVVDRQLLENNLPPLDVVGEYDTLSICKLFCSDFENYKLDTLCKKFGIVNERAHDAFFDVLATVGVLVHMVKYYILPTTDARVKILDRYKKKFKSFYDLFLQMKGLVLKNKIEELADFIEKEFSLFKLYDRVEDKVAYSDLMNVISSYRERILGGENLLVTLICEASLSGSQIDFLIKKLNKIPIITVHQSKGCEFDTVIIVGCDSYNFPSFSAVKSGNGSEEERVFYVAITRAKKRLVITNYSDGEGRDLSPFIDRLPCEFVEKYNF